MENQAQLIGTNAICTDKIILTYMEVKKIGDVKRLEKRFNFGQAALTLICLARAIA